MCEYTSRKNKRRALRFFKDNQAIEFNVHVLLHIFPFAFREGCCPKCGTYLETFERRPRGKATRSMCSDDYAWVVNTINYECFVCHEFLPDRKIMVQHKNIRELKHHIHDGLCNHLWTIIHNVSVGEPDIVRLSGQESKPNLIFSHSDHLNVTHDGRAGSQLPIYYQDQLPLPPHVPKALPYPVSQPRIPIRRIHREKNVKAVPIKFLK